MNIKDQVSFKKLALTKANTQMVAVAAVAAFVTVLSLGAAHYFYGIRSYQSKVLAADQIADRQLRIDVGAKNQLDSSYQKFVNQQPNILGKVGNGNYPYNNATIILDALPSEYDFPALTSTIQNLLHSGNFDISSIGGTDQSGSVSSAPEANPQPVAIPFSFSIQNSTYANVQSLFTLMQESILPLQIDNMTISGSDNNMTVAINAHTYFQPPKELKISKETIQ